MPVVYCQLLVPMFQRGRSTNQNIDHLPNWTAGCGNGVGRFLVN